MGILRSLLPDSIYTSYLRLKNSVASEKVQHDAPEVLSRREVFYRRFAGPGDLVFDVGANYGNRIIPLLQIGCKVIAVEPQERCYRYLEKRFGNSITLVKNGLSEKEEEREFYISNSSTISTFSKEWIGKVKEGRFKFYTWDRTATVQMTTLDKLIEIYGTPKFIKIDVEGFEYEVLKGLHRPVDVISIEYNVPENLSVTENCLRYLENLAPGSMYNYSVGESMTLVHESWLVAEQMFRLLRSKEFIETSFGDIYICKNTASLNN